VFRGTVTVCRIVDEIVNNFIQMPRKKIASFQQALEGIEFDILSGFYSPRERLVESELMKRYSTTRGTIRRALKELQFKHMIKHFLNRGAVVSDLSFKEAEDLYATRLLLEGHAAGLVVEKIDKKVLAELADLEKAFSQAVVRNDLRDIMNTNKLFHQRLFEASGSRVLAELIEQVRVRCHLWQHYIVGHPDRLSKTVEEHRSMLRALKKRDAEKFKNFVLTHITSAFLAYREDSIRFRKDGQDAYSII
jgi:DNA-binding GntR family transcriptional regulator